MGFIKSILDDYNKKKHEINEECNLLVDNILMILSDVEGKLDTNEFIDLIVVDLWLKDYQSTLDILNNDNLKKYKRCTKYKSLNENKEKLLSLINSLEDIINKHNNELADSYIDDAYALIGDVEGRKLDQQQMSCIVKDVSNHLVVAGAGTGKTTTIIGKIKYLLKSNNYNYNDILVLSFTNASASEMSERIKKETGCHIEALTFHKLGLNILTKVEGKVPNIYSDNIRTLIKEVLEEKIKDKEYLKLIVRYLMNNKVNVTHEFEFDSYKEYEEYLKANPPMTLQKEKVKGYGEMNIANFLFVNRIQYQYEASYCVDTRDEEHAQYHPDFYLPEYHIYIEYFGVDRDNEPPSYFKDREGYKESMLWKRKLHKENNTKLIEFYAYENMEDILEECLKERLQQASVKCNPMSDKEVFDLLAEDKQVFTGLIDLISTIINLIKSNSYTIQYVRELSQKTKYKKQNEVLLNILEPIYHTYEEHLTSHHMIDFNDMINKASQYIRDNQYNHDYKYVIVDEYQDISKARYNLLKEMRNNNYFKLFCVGDDWQSIYRFNGSDIDYIVHFNKYWGPSQISRIETTYRFNQSLIDISGRFVMENPYQIRKHIHSKMENNSFALGMISGYTKEVVISNLLKRLDDLPKNASVFFLGRYKFDIKVLDNNPHLKYQYDNVNKVVRVHYAKRSDLHITFLTAHTSKGLQADYIFILNNENSIMGFPSKISDAPLVELLLEGKDNYAYSEERRLFYVALTRAKIKTFLLVITSKKSVFINELESHYENDLKREYFTCPLCGGRLIKRNGKYGEFFGCSNYKDNGCKYIRKI